MRRIAVALCSFVQWVGVLALLVILAHNLSKSPWVSIEAEALTWSLVGLAGGSSILKHFLSNPIDAWGRVFQGWDLITGLVLVTMVFVHSHTAG